MRRTLKIVLRLFLLTLAALWLGNSSLLVRAPDADATRIIAHRGVHQVYTGTDRRAEACHAAPVAPITHSFIENTLPSMAEAFRLGADIVELDIHLTTDQRLAVFHDWTLDCRTNGTGVTHKQAWADLRPLDLAYNIDDGSGTYPLRGQGAGLMSTLDSVLAAELGGQYLVNFKSRRAEDAAALAELLEGTASHSQIFGVYGGAEPTRAAQARLPGLRGFDRISIRACLLRYAALGWSGYVPPACRNTLLMVPMNFGPYLWGWPHRFTKRLSAAGTDVILAGPYDGSGFSSGIDSAATFDKVPDRFQGYLWTNRIEQIGPLLHQRQSAAE